MNALSYVRIIRMGSMVEPSRVKRRGARKELTALQDGDWIEGVLTKPVRVGDGFRLRVFITMAKLVGAFTSLPQW
jgi:hypothetical protein